MDVPHAGFMAGRDIEDCWRVAGYLFVSIPKGKGADQ